MNPQPPRLPTARLIWLTEKAEEVLAYCARVSSPNQDNPEIAGLLRYCARNGHWSVFEQAAACLEIVTSRAVARQILRHKSLCVAADTEISFEVPYQLHKKGRRAARKIPIGRLYQRFIEWPERYQQMLCRVLDTDTNQFTTTHIVDVYNAGLRPGFRITLADGKSITASKEHHFLTSDGWKTLEEAVGLSVTASGVASMSRECFLITNGEFAYRSAQWLSDAKDRGLSVGEMAEAANCSYHTIRKWLKRYGLQFPFGGASRFQSEPGIPWNKGRFGYKTSLKHTDEFKAKMRLLRSGPNSNLWKGGTASIRKRVASWTHQQAPAVHAKFDYTCQMCGVRGGRLHVHHIEPVSARPDLALDFENLVTVCLTCHYNHHKINGDAKVWRAKHLGRTLVPCTTKIEKIEYVGLVEMYDIAVEHPSHNYVANGIVVHNSFQEFSQRYSSVTDYGFVRARRQDVKNRQNSIDDLSEETQAWFEGAQGDVLELAHSVYEAALQRGIAKECARAVLPEGLTLSRLYAAGSLRSWIHYLQVRTDPATQLEHREVALAIQAILAAELPILAAAFGWEVES